MFQNWTEVIELAETANLAYFGLEIKLNATVDLSEIGIMSFFVQFWAFPTANNWKQAQAM